MILNRAIFFFQPVSSAAPFINFTILSIQSLLIPFSIIFVRHIRHFLPPSKRISLSCNNFNFNQIGEQQWGNIEKAKFRESAWQLVVANVRTCSRQFDQVVELSSWWGVVLHQFSPMAECAPSPRAIRIRVESR